ncbi:MAG: ABC transporter substrate-binding protein, partial [Terrimesophilobacter sp.]
MRIRNQLGALVVASALVLTGCSAGTTTPSADNSAPKTLVIGNNGDAITWDPAEMKEGAIIQYADAVYDPLLRKTADSKIEGNLASDFKYNDDNTELTLVLQKGIKFSDGTDFNAQAVEANIEARKAGAGSASEAAKGITKVNIVDDNTVKLELAAPNPGLLAALATYLGYMASPDAIKAGTLATDPVGSGPYTLNKS